MLLSIYAVYIYCFFFFPRVQISDPEYVLLIVFFLIFILFNI